MKKEAVDDAFKRARRGDARALTMYYNLYKQGLFAFIMRRVSSCEESEEIFTEAMRRLFFNFHKIFSPRFVSAYLFRTARNLINDYYRHLTRRPVSVPLDRLECEPADGTDPPDVSLERKEDALALRRAMLRLPPAELQAVTAFYDEDLSTAEIAAATGRSSKAVEALLYRAKRRLRRTLNREGAV